MKALMKFATEKKKLSDYASVAGVAGATGAFTGAALGSVTGLVRGIASKEKGSIKKHMNRHARKGALIGGGAGQVAAVGSMERGKELIAKYKNRRKRSESPHRFQDQLN